ncbi:MAG: T9SS type A sorting domain-containing protein, partial [Ferruginibacter sp.]
AAFASGHLYNVPFGKAMAVGSSGYYIITVNVDAAGTDNHTLKVNGAANPVVFGFTTSPNIVNNQSDIAGVQTIQAADIVINTSTVATNKFNRGSNSNIVYVSQMQVATEPVTVNNLQFTLTGTHVANDLTIASIYFNATAPNLTGATLLNNVSATFASGHLYNAPFGKLMAVGSSGYYIITVNVSPTATIGNTVIIDGAVNPVIFGFITAPNITNNQSNVGGVHTLPVHFVSIEAAQKGESVEIKWNVDNELNIENYILERSGDGGDFIEIGQTATTGNNTNMITYHSLDVSPLRGNNFYRVCAVNMDGAKQYSSVVKINMDKNFKGISIYPNPVIKNGLVTMSFQNMDKNKYSVKLYNRQGQCIMARSVEHSGGNSTQTISLPRIATGSYIIVVSTTNMTFEKQILVE